MTPAPFPTAAFEEGERAAASDAPRWICNYAPDDERYDAWQAGYDWESRDDGPYVLASVDAHLDDMRTRELESQSEQSRREWMRRQTQGDER